MALTTYLQGDDTLLLNLLLVLIQHQPCFTPIHVLHPRWHLGRGLGGWDSPTTDPAGDTWLFPANLPGGSNGLASLQGWNRRNAGLSRYVVARGASGTWGSGCESCNEQVGGGTSVPRDKCTLSAAPRKLLKSGPGRSEHPISYSVKQFTPERVMREG